MELAFQLKINKGGGADLLLGWKGFSFVSKQAWKLVNLRVGAFVGPTHMALAVV